MRFFLKILGGGMLVVLAVSLSKGYKCFLENRLKEYEGLLSLISHFDMKVRNYLSFGSAVWRDFSNEIMEKCGVLPLLRDGETLSSALEKCKNKLTLPTEIKEKLLSKIKDLGQGYLNDEKEMLSEIKDMISKNLKKETEEIEKNVKVADALLFGCAAVIIIMSL